MENYLKEQSERLLWIYFSKDVGMTLLIWSNEFGVTKGCVLEERYVKFVKKVTEIFELLLYNGRRQTKLNTG